MDFSFCLRLGHRSDVRQLGAENLKRLFHHGIRPGTLEQHEPLVLFLCGPNLRHRWTRWISVCEFKDAETHRLTDLTLAQLRNRTDIVFLFYHGTSRRRLLCK